MEQNNLAAGPGATPEVGVAPEALLSGATEYEYVEIVNPLSVDFIGQVGVTRPTYQPFPKEEEIKRNYSLDLRNPAHQAKAHIVNKIPIKAGQSIRLLGNEASVIVSQLVTEILQREGKKLLLSDPHARREVEERVVLRRGAVSDFMQTRPSTVSEQLQQAIKEPTDEKEFPGANQSESQTDQRATEQPQRRGPGRPPKAQSTSI